MSIAPIFRVAQILLIFLPNANLNLLQDLLSHETKALSQDRIPSMGDSPSSEPSHRGLNGLGAKLTLSLNDKANAGPHRNESSHFAAPSSALFA